MRSEFKNKLAELGYTSAMDDEFAYLLYKIENKLITVIFKIEEAQPQSNEVKMSPNGNELQAVASFQLNTIEDNIDFMVLAFRNDFKNCSEFITIPIEEFKHRYLKNNRIPNELEPLRLVFWLMPDNCLYETSNMSLEGEWYYMSKGVNGRMADDTEMNYTEYLNNWNFFIV